MLTTWTNLTQKAWANLAGAFAGVVVFVTWFSRGEFLAAGDVPVMLRPSVSETLLSMWNFQNSAGGGVSYEVARVWEVLFTEGFGALPFAGEALGQRMLFALAFAWSARGVARLAGMYTTRGWVAAAAGVSAAFSPYVALQAPNALPSLAIGFVGSALAMLVGCARGDRAGWMRWVMLLLPLSYLCINPPLLVLCLVVLLGGPLGVKLLEQRQWQARTVAGPIAVALATTTWWLVPFVVTVVSATVQGTVRATTDVNAWSWTHRNSSLANVFSMRAHWGLDDSLYVGNVSTYFSPMLSWTAWVMPLLLVAAPFVTTGALRRVARVSLVAYLALTFFSKGLHAPLGWVNALFYDYVPGSFLLREPFSKLGVLMAVLAGVGMAITLDRVVTRVWTLRGYEQVFSLGAIGLVFGAVAAAAMPVWAAGTLERRIETSIAVPSEWQAAAAVLNADADGGKVLVLPLADFYQMPTTWGYYGIDSLPRQLIKRPVLQRLPENYIGDSAEFDDVMLEMERSITVGDVKRFERLLAVAGVRFVIVRKDYDIASSVRAPQLRISAAQAVRALEVLRGGKVYDSSLVEAWEMPRVVPRFSAAQAVSSSTSNAETVSLLSDGEALISAQDAQLVDGSARMEVVSATTRTFRMPFAGTAVAFPQRATRFALVGDARGAFLEPQIGIQVGQVDVATSARVALGGDVIAVATAGGTYALGDELIVEASEELVVAQDRGSVGDAVLRHGECRTGSKKPGLPASFSTCSEIRVEGLDSTVAHVLNLSWVGSMEQGCEVVNGCEVFRTSPAGPALLRVPAGVNGVTLRLEPGTRSAVSGLAVDVRAVREQSARAPAVSHQVELGDVRAGEMVRFERHNASTLALTAATDCSGNTGKRSIIGGGLWLDSKKTTPCTGFSLETPTHGSEIEVIVELGSGRASACLFDHASNKCIAEQTNATRLTLRGEAGVAEFGGLSLYLYPGESRAQVTRITTSETGSWDVMLRTSETMPQRKLQYSWEGGSRSGAVSVGQGAPGVLVSAYQDSATWRSSLQQVRVNSFAAGWFLPEGAVSAQIKVGLRWVHIAGQLTAVMALLVAIGASVRTRRRRGADLTTLPASELPNTGAEVEPHASVANDGPETPAASIRRSTALMNALRDVLRLVQQAGTPRTYLWRVAGFLPVAAVMGGALPALISTLQGGSIALLDLAPLRDPWMIMLGAEDGIADAPLFHLLLSVLTWWVGMGAGTLMTVVVCVAVAMAGVAVFVGERISGAIAAMAFVAAPFALTRIHHGQVAFLCAVGLTLIASQKAAESKRGAALWWAAGVMFAPHVLVLGAPVVLWRVRGWRVRLWMVVPAGLAMLPLFVARGGLDVSMLPAMLERFEVRYDEGGVWAAITQQGFWAGDVAGWSGVAAAVLGLVSVLFLRGRAKLALGAVLIAAPLLLPGLTGVLGVLIPVVPPLAMLREPHKLVIVLAVGCAWAVGRVAQQRSGNVQVCLLVCLAALAVVGLAGSLDGRVLSVESVRALDDVRARVDGGVLVVPVQRYAHVWDVDGEVQDLVPRWLGGEAMVELAPYGKTGQARNNAQKQFTASGGEDTSVWKYGYNWVVGLRQDKDGMRWLERHRDLEKVVSGRVELYRVRQTARCGAECETVQTSHSTTIWLLVASFGGPVGWVATPAAVRATRRRKWAKAGQVPPALEVW